MALSPTTLQTGLLEMDQLDSEDDAVSAFVDAWDAYFSAATVLIATVVDETLGAGLEAMEAELETIAEDPEAEPPIEGQDGLSVDAASAIARGISAFWDEIATTAPTVWVVAPVIVPESLVAPTGIEVETMTTTIQDVFDANLTAELPLAAATLALATAIHTANLGGTVDLVPPPAGGTLLVPIL